MNLEEKQLTGCPSIDKPWLKYYPKEVLQGKPPACTLYECLLANNKEHQSDVAIIYLGKKIAYKKLFQMITAYEKSFFALGVKPGEIVTIALPSIPEVYYVVFALDKLGAVSNMIHPLAGEQEIINYLNEVASRVAVLFDKTYQMIKERLKETKLEHIIVLSAGDSMPQPLKTLYGFKNRRTQSLQFAISQKEFLERGKNGNTSDYRRDIDAVSVISHTGGTTGEPKGVMLSDRNINALMWQVVTTWSVKRGQSTLVQLPPFVNYSLVNSMLQAVIYGVKAILIPKYEREKIGYYLRKYKPSWISSIPTYLEAILEDESIQKMDLSFFCGIFSGGEALNTDKEQELNELFDSCGAKIKVSQGYGMTELVSCATFGFKEGNKIGSAGIPLPKINCKIVEPDHGDELSCNKVGEVCFAGDTVMLGYYKNKQATDEMIQTDEKGIRWLHTGDLGYLTEDGLLYLVGRMKRVMITKGKDGMPTKLFPDRIEKVLEELPAVKSCCVVGIEDPERVHYPKAFIILEKPAMRIASMQEKKETDIREELFGYCRKHLPEYQVPEEIEFLEEFPLTERGKVDYRELEKSGRETKS